jgi:hypothetical protein
LQRLEQSANVRSVSPYTLAVHMLVLGERDRALEQLERAYQERAGVLAFLKTDPAVDSLRGTARLNALVANVTQSSR